MLSSRRQTKAIPKNPFIFCLPTYPILLTAPLQRRAWNLLSVSLDPVLPPGVADNELANCTVAPAPTPMSNYQIPVPQYGYGGNSDVDGMYDYSWPSVLGAGRPISSLSSMPSMSTFPPAHIGNYLGNVFDNGYNGYLQSDDMFSQLPPPYPSVPSPLPPLLDDSMDSRLRSLSSSPASSSRSALDDPLDFAFLGRNVPHQYLLLSTT
jgi:hypothetical protein